MIPEMTTRRVVDFGLGWLIVSCAFSSLAQGPAWQEEDAVRHALAFAGMDTKLRADIDSAKATTASRILPANPRVEVMRETLNGGVNGDMAEMSIIARQSFDITPWRRKLREAQDHQEAALRHQTHSDKIEIAAKVRSAFFGVRYHQERQEVLTAWLARLEDGVRLMSERERRGDVSLLSVRRIERERDLAVAELAREASLLAEAWAGLQRRVSWQRRPTLHGSLNPERQIPSGSQVLPHLAHLTALDRSLQAAEQAWGSPFLRDWQLGAGYRFEQQAGDRDTGYHLSLGIPLVFWNKDRPRQRRLRARQARLKDELRQARTQAEQAEDAARQRLQHIFDNQDRLPPAEQDDDLIVLAMAAFEAGEEPLSELLAAYRGDLDLKLARLDLAWEARRAKIELERLIGLGVPR